MKNLLSLTLAVFLSSFGVRAQVVIADPALPTDGDALTITFNATQGSGGLQDYSGDIYAHTGVLTNLSTGSTNWRYVKTDWGENSEETKMTRVSANSYTLDIGPSIREYYDVPAGETISHIAFVFRSSDSGLEGKGEGGSDIFVEVYPEGLGVSIIRPDKNQILDAGSGLDFEAAASQSASLALYQNNSEVKRLIGTSLEHSFTFSSTGDYWLKITAEADDTLVADSVFVHIMDEQVEQALPEGMMDGVNYLDDHTAVLVLHAPYKEHVFVTGDFNNWTPGSTARMMKDGDRWWRTINGLESGTEYGYQYFVDGEVLIADPYTEKTLDPNDKGIPEATYPNLKTYPSGKTTGICSVLETGQVEYVWDHSDFAAPEHENLVIYELLVRDFIAAHDWKTLTDTLDYFTKLGINAIELMPVNEFEGNESWGYNPSFYFAADKYYGPADDLKVFIDSCHGRGIAVIIDMVLNHSFSQSPLVQLYFENGMVTSQNPWYNVESPNPVFAWGYDFDHESQDTRNFVDRVNTYWLDEFNVDGFRFDFTKGFTNTPGDGWAYDASRINILKRMADVIWEENPEAYVILEHLSENSEEKVLASQGMMLWGNMNYNYNEATMGWHDDNRSDFSGISYKSRGWSTPQLVGYMESHDEERLMFKNLEYGNSAGSYNIQDEETALQRLELAGAFFFTIPGPRMIWQFGELGYDYSINYDCRVCNKPIRWDYNSGKRRRVYEVWGALAMLKTSEPAFSSSDFSLDLDQAMKSISINHEDMNVRIIGNFGVSIASQVATFSHTGTWYEYFSGDSIELSDVNMPFIMKPGEYRLFTSKRLTPPEITTSMPTTLSLSSTIKVYPNPTGGKLYMESLEEESLVRIFNSAGQLLISKTLSPLEENIDLGSLETGLYLLRRDSPLNGSQTARILKY